MVLMGKLVLQVLRKHTNTSMKMAMPVHGAGSGRVEMATGSEYADTIKFTITVLQLGNIEYFYADKLTIEPGDSTLLKWSVVGGDCCSYITLNGDSAGRI